MERDVWSTCTPSTAYQDPLQYLPTELCILILEHLDAVSLATGCKVCHQWLSFASIDILWKKLHLRELRHVSSANTLNVSNPLPPSSWKSTFGTRYRLEKNWDFRQYTVATLNVGFNVSVLRLHGEHLFSGDTTGTILIWDIPSRVPLELLLGSERSEVRSLELDTSDPKRDVLVAGHRSGALVVWHIPSAQVLQYIPDAHNKSIDTIRVNDRYVVTGSADNTIGVWTRPLYPTHTTPTTSMPISTSASITSTWTFPLRLAWTLTGHTSVISALSLSGNTLVSSSPGDCTIRTWDLTTGQCMASYLRPGSVAYGHLDGQRLCIEGQVRLYDEKAGRQMSALHVPQRVILAACAVYRQGRLERLVTAGSGGCVMWRKELGWVEQYRLVGDEVSPALGGQVKLPVFRYCQVDERRIVCASKGRIVVWDFSC